MVGWLAGWLAVWLAGWQNGWLVGWLAEWLPQAKQNETKQNKCSGHDLIRNTTSIRKAKNAEEEDEPPKTPSKYTPEQKHNNIKNKYTPEQRHNNY